jgi:3-oxoacyl-[acyl-carrier-protein] synthase-1
MTQRVVITGIGLYSSIGIGIEKVNDSLMNGRSGIVYDERRNEFGFQSCLTGMVQDPDLKGELSRRQRVGMHQPAKFSYVATAEALGQAGLDVDFLEKNDTGIIFGNDSTAGAVIETIDKVRLKKDTSLIGSGDIFQNMNCTVNMNLSTIFKLKGINFTVSAACASGSHSIGLAYLLIKQGLQDRIICGGAQEINSYAMGSFDCFGVFSNNEKNPEKASRPFDKNRSGLVPSGGAAALVVESLESAQKRGANILGEVVGYGFSSNGDHISNPNIEGQLKSLNMALLQSGVRASDIDYINAHATSTPVGDSVEAAAISRLFGSKVCVSSTKSMTGHECWMAGASEIAYSLLMMQNDYVAPNINFETPDEFSQKINVVSKKLNKNINCFLSNSFGFGGTNSSIIVKKFVS